MAKKKSSDELSVPQAISEVARGVATARAMKPHDHSDAGPADADGDAKAEAPQRSRAELQADIAKTRAQLAGLVDEIEHRLDVPARAEVIVDDFKADPKRAVVTHKKTTITAIVLVAAIGTGIGLLVRAIVTK
jgi:hypothetical protein